MKINLFTLICLIILSKNVGAQTWDEMGSGGAALKANGVINQLCTDTANNVYAAGAFTNAGGKQYVARWTGTSWSELGAGSSVLNANNQVFSLCTDKYGYIYAAGAFTNAIAHWRVARWDGAAWSDLGSMLINDDILALCTDTSGNIYAAGKFHYPSSDRKLVVKWNGTSWSELGTGISAGSGPGNIQALATDKAGNVYAAGSFNNAEGKYYVAMWNGVSWSELGTLKANNVITVLKTDNDGNVYAAGNFTNISSFRYVAKWDGSYWSELGTGSAALNANGQISSMEINPESATMLVAGMFKDAGGNFYVARWDGSAWSELGSGVTDVADIRAVAKDREDHAYAAGWFTNSANKYYVAEYGGIVPAASIQEAGKLGVKIYPNPASSTIHVELQQQSGENTYAIADITGRSVQKGTLKGTTDIDVSRLPKGIYILDLGSDIRAFKFVKE